MAKKKHSFSSKSGFRLGAMKINKGDLLLCIGAASAGVIGGIVGKLTQNKLTGNVAQAIGGVGLAFLGKNPAQIGKGVLMATGAQLIEDNIIPKIDQLFTSGGGSGATGGQKAPPPTNNGATF